METDPVRLLHEANEQLSQLNFEHEMTIISLREQILKNKELTCELEKSNQKLSEMSFEDSLTGLHNRRYLFDVVDNEISRAERYGRQFSLLLFDIDFFKKVNDSYGHHAGDSILREVSDILRQLKRKTDIAVRYGGDEFVVVLPETDLDQAMTFAERLRANVVGNCSLVNNKKISITISVGVTNYIVGRTITPLEFLIDVADKALYDAKNMGRNRVSFLSSVDTEGLSGGEDIQYV